MKKIGFLLIVGILTGLFGIQTTFALEDSFYYDNVVEESITTSQQMTDLGKIIKTDNISNGNNKEDNQNSLLYKIRGFFKLNGDRYKDEPAIAYIQMLVNMALGLVSFISLILIIFAFYLILFDKGEDGVKKAKSVMTGVAIAIVLMGLSWLIVSFFFDLYSNEVV